MKDYFEISIDWRTIVLFVTQFNNQNDYYPKYETRMKWKKVGGANNEILHLLHQWVKAQNITQSKTP